MGVAPDWTNQARLVSRAEDIVINRDLERGDGGGGVSFEKTMIMRTLNGQKENEESLKSDSMNEGIKYYSSSSTTTPVQ